MRTEVRWRGKKPFRRPSVQSHDEQTRRKPLRTSAATTILVGSFLVLNAPPSAHAAPQPVRPMQTGSRHARAIAETMGRAHRRAPGQRSFDEVDDAIAHPVTAPEHLVYTFGDTEEAEPLFFAQPTPTRSSLVRRASGTSSDSSGKQLYTVPPSFASNIASSWDPGKRSIWFQRKAVIITSIFLAIFIVLIMGCAVFLRTKRDDDEDLDYDESDEAALERMRKEREDRQQRQSEPGKKSKRKRRKDAVTANTADQMDEKDGDSVEATAIVAPRWSRNPVRRIKLRRRQRKMAKSDDSSDTRVAAVSNRAGSQSSESGRYHSRSTLDSAHNGTTLVASTNESSGTSHGAAFETPSDHPVAYADIAALRDGAATESHTAESSAYDASADSAHGSTRRPGTLTEQDIALADAEASRSAVEMMPPAYRPNGAGGNGAVPARRMLAGEDAERREREEQETQRHFHEARGDRKTAPQDEEAENGGDTSTPMTRSHDEPGLLRMPSRGADGQADAAARQDGASTSHAAGLSGHIATDEKAVLSQMRAAASQPDTAPQYAPSTLHATSGASRPGQPLITPATAGPTAPDLEADEEQEAITASREALDYPDEKGKGSAQFLQQSGASRLPPPPAAQQDAAFSRFDMPYVLERPALSRPNSSAPEAPSAPSMPSSPPTARQREKEKQHEAEEEERHALSLLASQPGEGRDLPQYESASASAPPSAPSAPAFEEDSVTHESDPHGAAASAPSAPPLDDDA